MENTPDTPAIVVDPVLLPGAVLAAARVARGLSIEDISRQLKLSLAQVKAIEADDHSHLPSSPVFVRGFIRSYARMLKLDEAKVLPPKLVVATPQVAPSSVLSVPADVRLMRDANRESVEPSPYRRVPALLAGIACVLLALAYYEFVLNAPPAPVVPIVPTVPAAPTVPPVAPVVRAEPVVPEPAPVSAPAVESAATATPAAVVVVEPSAAKTEAPVEPLKLKKSSDPISGATHGLRFAFSGESWVEVRDAKGKVIFSKTNAAGTEQRVVGVAPLSVVVGGASKVTLAFNGKPVDLEPYAANDVARLVLE